MTDTNNYGSAATPRYSIGNLLFNSNSSEDSALNPNNPWIDFCLALPFFVVYAIAYFQSAEDIQNDAFTDDCTHFPNIINYYMIFKGIVWVECIYMYYVWTGERFFDKLCCCKNNTTWSKKFAELLIMTAISIWAVYDYYGMSNDCLDAMEDVGSKYWRVVVEMFAIHSIVYISFAGFMICIFPCCVFGMVTMGLARQGDFTFEDNNV